MGSCLLTDLRFAHQSRCPGSFYHPSKRCGHCPARETGSLYHGNRCVGTLTVTGLLRLWSTKRWNFLSSEFRMTSSSTDCTDIVKQSSKVPRRHDPFEASMWHKPTPKPKLSMVVWGQPTCRSYKLQWRGSVHFLFSISRNKWSYGETLPFQERNGILKRKGNCPDIMYLQMDRSKLSSCLIALIHGPQLSCKQCANVQSFLWSVSIMMS